MNSPRIDRRTLLRSALTGLAAIPAASLMREALADTAPHLDQKDPTAVSLGYVEDVSKLDPATSSQHKPGAKCLNCVQLAGKEGDDWRPCNLFPGKLVHKDGWCKVWTLKPGATIG